MSDEPKACEGGETTTRVIGCTDFEECQHCKAAVRHDLVDHPAFGFRRCHAEPERCLKCGKTLAESKVLINGRCCGCNPFRACPKCIVGTLQSKPTPNWMNRWVCDRCGCKRSR